jgi:hypothetical protein
MKCCRCARIAQGRTQYREERELLRRRLQDLVKRSRQPQEAAEVMSMLLIMNNRELKWLLDSPEQLTQAIGGAAGVGAATLPGPPRSSSGRPMLLPPGVVHCRQSPGVVDTPMVTSLPVGEPPNAEATEAEPPVPPVKADRRTTMMALLLLYEHRYNTTSRDL